MAAHSYSHKSIMAYLDSYIYRMRARNTPPRDPDVVTVNRQQADVMIRYAKERSWQLEVTLREDGSLDKYRGIKVRVVP